MVKEGQLVAFPTETVYGLGADALNDGQQKLYQYGKFETDTFDGVYYFRIWWCRPGIAPCRQSNKHQRGNVNLLLLWMEPQRYVYMQSYLVRSKSLHLLAIMHQTGQLRSTRVL